MNSAIHRINLEVFPAVFSFLPSNMDSLPARAQLLSTALQESECKYRVQSNGGPAHGFLQFELGGGVIGVLTHNATKNLAAEACDWQQVERHSRAVYEAIVHNDVLAFIFGRLLLWTLPAALPERTESAKGWEQYLAAWRPGMPHPEKWPANFAAAWEVVAPLPRQL